MSKPMLHIHVRDGIAVLTQVTLNGEPFNHATRISFDTGEDIHGVVTVRMEFYADIEVEMDGGNIELVPVRRPKAGQSALPNDTVPA